MTSARRHTIVVTDGEQRATLALVRALGRQGHTLHVCSASGRSITGASRYTASERRVADALAHPEQFTADVRAAVADTAADVLIPVSEVALLTLLAAREQFVGVTIPFAELDSFQRISDKSAVVDAARRLGIATPVQTTLHTPDDLATLQPETLQFPLVIKPARSVSGGDGARIKLGVQYAESMTELRKIVAELDARAYPLLLQQRVVGPGIGIFLLLWDGEIIAAFSHRRIREKPPSGGVSVYREGIALDPALLARSRALLDAFDWQGVAMIEYKLDARTGTPYIMEINGRFWGSLQLAVESGVDFPSLLVSAAMHERPVPVTTYTPGIRCRWWWGDVDQLITRLRRSPRTLALPPDAPTRWQSVRDFCRVGDSRDRDEMLQRHDPMPFLRETIQWLTRQ